MGVVLSTEVINERLQIIDKITKLNLSKFDLGNKYN